MTLLTTREALAKALFDAAFPGERENDPYWYEAYEQDWYANADRLLASGAVVDAATLADDEALVERLARALNAADDEALVRTNFGQITASYAESAQAALRALAAALSEPVETREAAR